MNRSARSTALFCARAGAIAFALTACGYLVVTAQRRANPPAAATPGVVDVPATDIEASPTDGTFLQGSKSLVLDPPVTVTTEDGKAVDAQLEGSTFLSSSKSLNWSPQPNPPPLVFPPIEPEPTASTHFLPSSKSGAVTTTAPEAPPPATEPVFLPSSKVKTLSPLRPQTATPGTTSTSERVFLPSSKSLRIGEGKAPAPKPAPKPAPAPTEPPKQP